MRSFKLNPYYYRFKKFRDKVRAEGSTNKQTWDNHNWIFGGQSLFVLPENINLFIKEKLGDIYKRPNLSLKIFDTLPLHPYTPTHQAYWGSCQENDPGRLVISTTIQNFYSMENLAPRVYDLVFIEESKNRIKFAAQVCETQSEGDTSVKDRYTEKYLEAVQKTSDLSNLWAVNFCDVHPNNFIDEKFVDFQRFSFKPTFRPWLVQRVSPQLGFGDETPYQSIEELGVKGKRENLTRFSLFDKSFQEDKKVLPPNFTVWDVGCNGGFFLRRSFDWGAGYGRGTDIDRVVRAASEITYYLGYFNADYDIKNPTENFDLIFYLSMHQHTDITKYIKRFNHLFYFETNAGEDKNHWENFLKNYGQVKYLGVSKDFGERFLFSVSR